MERKKLLLVNDDGYFSEGILILYEVLKKRFLVKVVAPDRNLSGAGHSLTFTKPLRIRQVDRDIYTVIEGTPADCVHLGVGVIFEGKKPDLVVSGINKGPNLGEDITYSGTVAGAMEGAILGIPSIAVSLFARDNFLFEDASLVVLDLINLVLAEKFRKNLYLNVNIPNIPYREIKAYAVTRQGHRNYKELVIRYKDPYGQPIYWIAATKFNWRAEPWSDYWAVANGFVSITPLDLDLTSPLVKKGIALFY
ncbi:MAG TPA: 5'/3'-nucleotidase SurE [Aquifex aeolicus]|uniref:5'-nucleotidase SurE n=1 Tax=Aquifex aeolicus TaxID=63363 RepID=A0A9D0YQ87_AQUAO|nr:5'/3'-nucleotidase SurE [Aquifex aeolicus]